MNKILEYNEFLLESRIPIAWANPNELTISILKHIDSVGKITKTELSEYLEGIPEELSQNKASMAWIKRRKKYIGYKIQEDSANYFYLTKLGKRIVKSSGINETT